jgi:hypothetical protein
MGDWKMPPYRHPRNINVAMRYAIIRCVDGTCNLDRCNMKDCPLIHLSKEMDSSLNILCNLLPDDCGEKSLFS